MMMVYKTNNTELFLNNRREEKEAMGVRGKKKRKNPAKSFFERKLTSSSDT